MPVLPTCSECGELRSDPRHDKANWANGGDGHPFELDLTSRPAAPVRKMTPAEKAADPGPIDAPRTNGKPLCRICKKPGVAHRGKRDHVFDPPGGFTSRAKDAPAPVKAAPLTDPQLFPTRKNKKLSKFDQKRLATKRSLELKKRTKAARKARRTYKIREKIVATDDRVQRCITIAKEIAELEAQIGAKREELREFLG